MADTTTSSDTDSAPLTEFVASYRSALLSNEQWARYGDQLRTYVIECNLDSLQRAKSFLGSIARFLADTDPSEPSLRNAVTRARVNTWLAAKTNGDIKRGTLQNHSGRLTWWLDVLHPEGAIARPVVGGVAPLRAYSIIETAALLELGAEVGQVVACGVAFGVAGHGVDGAFIAGDQLITHSGCIDRAPETQDMDIYLPQQPLGGGAWKRACSVAREAGIVLTKRRLRASWGARLLCASITGRELTSFGASRETLGHAAKSIEPDTDAALKAILEQIQQID